MDKRFLWFKDVYCLHNSKIYLDVYFLVFILLWESDRYWFVSLEIELNINFNNVRKLILIKKIAINYGPIIDLSLIILICKNILK